jgi:hypothetical protein
MENNGLGCDILEAWGEYGVSSNKNFGNILMFVVS